MKHTITGARLPIRFGASLALAVGLLGAPTAALADAQQFQLTVSATVLKRASLKVVAQPSAVVITEADLERGYVEVASPAQLAIRNNSAEGYLLVFASDGDFLRQARVRGLGAEVQIGAGGGVVRQPGGSTGTRVLDLGFRFELSPTARAGVYAWPMQISVVPL